MFTERQRFRQRWVWILLIGSISIAWWSFIQQIILGLPFGNRPSPDLIIWIIWAVFGVCMPWLFYVLRLETYVKADKLSVRFYPFRSRTIYFKDIKSYAIREYRPLREYGGWGIRCSSKNGMAFNVSGNKGVQLELVDGKKILIGSQKAEELAAALRQGIDR
jgi:hypothetical protein